MAEAITGWVRSKLGDSFMKLLYSITCTGPGELTTQDIIVDDLVNIRFKLKTSMHENQLKLHFSFSAKYNLSMDRKIKMNITSTGNLKYSIKGFEVPEQWTGWQEMGSTESIEQNKAYAFEFFITAFKVNENQLCLKLYSDEQFTDFKLATADGTVAVHRACLATVSEVFKAMLNGEWKETAEGQIKIGTASVQTLQQLKDYMYLDTVPDEGLRPLLLIARCYQIDDLEKHCIRKLAETVLPEDLFSLLEFACENLIPELSLALVQITHDFVISDAHRIRKKTVLGKQDEIKNVSSI